MNRILIYIITIWFFSVSIFADEFKVSAKIDSVPKTGYYEIQINPRLISFSKEDYSDIRLFSKRGDEVPYILREEQPATSITGFKEHIIIENRYLESKKMSRVVVHNITKKTFSSFVLVVRNSEVDKELIIKGSDNNKDWYFIQKDKLRRLGNYNETTGLFILEFPKSDYEYFELSTNDKKKDPIRIVKVGYYDSKFMEGLYSEVSVNKFSQKDSSDKKSYIIIHFDQNSEINRLNFKVSGPELFRRDAIIGNFRIQNDNKVFEYIESFEISSSKPSQWEFEKLRVSELVLVIMNYDNIPLKVEEVKAFQLNKYLIANLKTGESYFVRTANNLAIKPDYDLKYFSDSIPETLVTLNTNDIELSQIAQPDTPKVFFTKTVLWSVIILIVGLLAFLSVRMIKEMGKKE